MLWLEIIPMSIVYIVDNVSMGGGDKTECGGGEGRNLGCNLQKESRNPEAVSMLILTGSFVYPLLQSRSTQKQHPRC